MTDVLPEWQKLKFEGKGQRNTPCMTILGLQKLLLILDSKSAAKFSDHVLECFNRVLAGDRTLLCVIEPSQTARSRERITGRLIRKSGTCRTEIARKQRASCHTQQPVITRRQRAGRTTQPTKTARMGRTGGTTQQTKIV